MDVCPEPPLQRTVDRRPGFRPPLGRASGRPARETLQRWSVPTSVDVHLGPSGLPVLAQINWKFPERCPRTDRRNPINISASLGPERTRCPCSSRHLTSPRAAPPSRPPRAVVLVGHSVGSVIGVGPSGVGSDEARTAGGRSGSVTAGVRAVDLRPSAFPSYCTKSEAQTGHSAWISKRLMIISCSLSVGS